MLGNLGNPGDIGVLTRALDDGESLVREHAAWALARLVMPRTKAGAGDEKSAD